MREFSVRMPVCAFGQFTLPAKIGIGGRSVTMRDPLHNAAEMKV